MGGACRQARDPHIESRTTATSWPSAGRAVACARNAARASSARAHCTPRPQPRCPA